MIRRKTERCKYETYDRKVFDTEEEAIGHLTSKRDAVLSHLSDCLSDKCASDLRELLVKHERDFVDLSLTVRSAELPVTKHSMYEEVYITYDKTEHANRAAAEQYLKAKGRSIKERLAYCFAQHTIPTICNLFDEHRETFRELHTIHEDMNTCKEYVAPYSNK